MDFDALVELAPHQKMLVNRALTDKDGRLCRELIFRTNIGSCGKATGMFVEKLANRGKVVSVKITRTDVIIERFLFREDVDPTTPIPTMIVRLEDVVLPNDEDRSFGKYTVDQVEDAWKKVKELIEHLIEEAAREFHVHPFTARAKSK